MNGTARVNTRCAAVSSNNSLPNSESFGGGSNLMIDFRGICVKNGRAKHRFLQQYHADHEDCQASKGGREMEKARVTDQRMHADRGAKADGSSYQQNLPEAAARRAAPRQNHDQYPARTN